MKTAIGFSGLFPLFLLISTEGLLIDTEYEVNEGKVQQQIDNEITKYLEDVKQILQKEEKHKLTKRSTYGKISLTNLEGAPKFALVERLYQLPDPSAVDVVLFCLQLEENEKCFAASLLTSDTENFNRLVLYKLNGDEFSISHATEVKNGRRLATHNIGGAQYVVVAENLNNSDDVSNDLFISPVFRVNASSERLVLSHFLGDRHLTDAIIWEQTGTDHVFLATASSSFVNATSSQYGDQSHVYRWMGNHFDSIHTIATNNANRITPFTIGGTMFLAVANAGTDSQDGTDAYSAIYVYNLHEERFVLHQKLQIASDIKFFTLQSKDETETFLAVSNNVHSEDSEEQCIVIYKLLPDSYHFLPLQCLILEGGADMLLPIVREEAGLIASVLFVANRNLGLKIYQYDGWRFVESEVQLNQGEFAPGISSMRLFNFRGRNVVALVNKRSGSLIFSVVWKANDALKNLHTSLESWCDQVLKEEEELETMSNNLLLEAQSAPKVNGSSINIEGCLIFENPDTHTDTIDVVRNTGVKKPDNEVVRKKFDEVKEDVGKSNDVLKEFTTKELVFEEPVVLESAEFNCHHGCVFLDLEIGMLNGENFSVFLNNAYGLTNEQNKHIDKIEFDLLEVTANTDVNRINDRPTKYLVTSNNPQHRFNVNVDGKVTFNGEIYVNGEIDGVKFDSNLLLNGGDQVFNTSKLIVDSLIVDNLTVNNQTPKKLDENTKIKDFIPSLDVEDLKLVDNKISGVDFGDFVGKTLKKTSDEEQIIEGNHHYKVLIAKEIDASSFEPISKNGATVEKNGVEDLVIDYNNDVDENSSNLDLMSPKKCLTAECVEDQFRIDGDLAIDGSIVIENGMLFVGDVNLQHEKISFGDLLRDGLRIDSGLMSNVLFEAPIYVKHLNVGTVNNIDPNNWIDGCNPGKEPIDVTGHKVFTDSLNLEKGGSVTGEINEIPYDDLMSNTLKKDGDQDVEGFKHIGRITAKVIESDSLALKNYDVTGKAKTHSGGDLIVDRMKGNLLKARTINGVVLEDVMNDTLFKDNKTYRIESETTFFNGLKTEELFTDDVSELSNHTSARRSDTSHENKFPISKNVNLTAADVDRKFLKVDRLYFTGSLDGIKAGDFGNWLLVEGDQTIESLCTINNIEAKNGVKLTSNLINGVNIDELVKDTININEPIVLTSVVFEDEVTVAENGVNVDGLVNGDEFSENNLILRDSTEKTVIFSGEKVVKGNLEAQSLDVDELKTFCKVLGDPHDEHHPSQLTIVGDVNFSAEPTVKFLNDHNISALMDSLWFVDKDTIIDHDITFENVVFNGDINMNVDSELNGVNLSRLNEEYFSLTADQKISKEIIFDKIAADGLTVAGKVEAFDLVAGVKFDEFVSSVMRQKRRQKVTAILDFEDVELDGVLNVNASGKINGLDFEKDLMRWNNTVNVVRGKTYISGLKAQSLEAKPGILIQGVDINKWKQLAVTNSGNFTVKGKKTFDSNVYVDKDLRVHGLVNGLKFDRDSVLLSDGNQTINGYNQFGSETVLEIEDLLSNSLINGVNVTDLLDRLVCKDDSNLLVSGKKTFKSRFSTTNRVEMRRHFDGVDLVQLYNQLMNPLEGTNKDNRLYRLRMIRKDVEMSLARRAHLFTGWEKVCQVAGKVRVALPLMKSLQQVVFLGKFSVEKRRSKLSLDYWDAQNRTFIETGERKTFMKKPTDVSVVETVHGENRLFTLFKSRNTSVMTGVIYNVSSENGSLYHKAVGTFDSSAANSVLFLNEQCFLLWGVRVPLCYIYCSLQQVNSFACADVNEIIRYANESVVLVFLAKSTGDVEVKSFVGNDLHYLAKVAVSKEPALHLDVISQPITHHFIFVVCSETVVTFMRLDSDWRKMDEAALMLQKASARLLSLPTNEIIAIVMSSCSPPTTYRWAGLSQPQATNLPIGGSEIRQAYQFQDALGANYTLVVSNTETAVLKPRFFVDDF